MNKIYSLNWDSNHIVDDNLDAYHLTFQNSEMATLLFLHPKYKDKLPLELLFRANFNLIPKVDYPLTDLNIPILSNKMISILQECGNFDAIFTDVIMIDDTYLDNIFNSEGTLKNEVKIDKSYKALTIINREDCFDFKNSIYMPNELNPSIPGYIKKLILKKKSNFSPIFRIKESSSTLFITELAKNKLQQNDIEGCVFEEVETT
jgi:hypothetical protein